MADNPYSGQEGYERAWSDGFTAGNHDRNNSSPSAPGVFPPFDLTDEQIGWFQQVWQEGHLAGREAPEEGISADVQHHEQDDHNPVSTGAHTAEALVAGASLFKRHWGVLAVEVFLMVMIPSGAPRWEEEQGDVQSWFAGQCSSAGYSEWFMPVTWGESDEAPGWHGNAYTGFDGAKSEAVTYVQAGSAVSIAHYRCDTPDMMEIIELAYR